MVKRGINMEVVRSENRATILNLINDKGPISRKDIAEITGLTAASVTQITNQLIEEGLLFESGVSKEHTSAVGRKKILLDIHAGSSYVCAINIGKVSTAIAICDLKGRIVSSESGMPLFKIVETHNNVPPEKALNDICDECKEFIKSLPAKDRKKVECVSVGVAGVLDEEKKVVLNAAGLWETEVEIYSIIKKALKLPVYVENDVDALATAEMVFGTGREKDNLLLLLWDAGVGSAIIVNNKVYKGRGGRTTEVGHCIVDPNGVKCGCGRTGCLETKVSYTALCDIMEFEPDEFELAYKRTSDENRQKVDKAIDLFGQSLVNVGSVMAPRRVLLCGRMFRSELVRNKLINACKSYDPVYNEDRILHSSLHEREDYIGPAAVVVRKKLV